MTRPLRALAQLDRLAVRSVAIGVGPRFFSREELGGIQAAASAAFNQDRLDLLRAGEELAAEYSGIADAVERNEEEKGIETLFLALGLASWPALDGGTPAAAPVLLVPIEIEVRGREGRSFTLAAPEEGKNVAAIQALIGRDIPVVQIEGIAAAELDFEEGDRRRRRRAAPARKETAERRPARREQKRDEARRPERATPAEPRRSVAADNVTAFPRPAAEPRRRPERPQSEPEHRVVGFGDDLPAFLRRAPKVAAQA